MTACLPYQFRDGGTRGSSSELQAEASAQDTPEKLLMRTGTPLLAYLLAPREQEGRISL